MGLSTWDKQLFTCLSSRFVYGEKISEENLSTVDRAEQKLLDLGDYQTGSMNKILVQKQG